jgi:hypothetical protein
MPEPSPEQIDDFIARWEKSGGHERGAGQRFLLGCLSAIPHQLWARAAGGTLEDRPT